MKALTYSAFVEFGDNGSSRPHLPQNRAVEFWATGFVLTLAPRKWLTLTGILPLGRTTYVGWEVGYAKRWVMRFSFVLAGDNERTDKSHRKRMEGGWWREGLRMNCIHKSAYYKRNREGARTPLGVRGVESWYNYYAIVTKSRRGCNVQIWRKASMTTPLSIYGAQDNDAHVICLNIT